MVFVRGTWIAANTGQGTVGSKIVVAIKCRSGMMGELSSFFRSLTAWCFPFEMLVANPKSYVT